MGMSKQERIWFQNLFTGITLPSFVIEHARNKTITWAEAVLLSHILHDENYHATNSDLAHFIGVSIRQIQFMLKHLREANLLQTKRGFGRKLKIGPRFFRRGNP